jgi:hypothetical protein
MPHIPIIISRTVLYSLFRLIQIFPELKRGNIYFYDGALLFFKSCSLQLTPSHLPVKAPDKASFCTYTKLQFIRLAALLFIV